MSNRIARWELVLALDLALAGCEASTAGQQDAGCLKYCEGAAEYINSMNWNQAPRQVVPCDGLCSDPLAEDFERCCGVDPAPQHWRSCVEAASDSLWHDEPWSRLREWVMTAARYDPVREVLRIESSRLLSAGVTGCATDQVLDLVHEFPDRTGIVEIPPVVTEPGTVEGFEDAKWDALAGVAIDASGLGTFLPDVVTESEFDEAEPWWSTVYLRDLDGYLRTWILGLPRCPAP